MSTRPVVAGPPGFMSAGRKIALPCLLFAMVSEPAVNVLLGLAVWAEKSAPEPTATAIAQSPRARVPRVRLGRLSRRLATLASIGCAMSVIPTSWSPFVRPAGKVKSVEQSDNHVVEMDAGKSG